MTARLFNFLVLIGFLPVALCTPIAAEAEGKIDRVWMVVQYEIEYDGYKGSGSATMSWRPEHEDAPQIEKAGYTIRILISDFETEDLVADVSLHDQSGQIVNVAQVYIPEESESYFDLTVPGTRIEGSIRLKSLSRVPLEQ